MHEVERYELSEGPAYTFSVTRRELFGVTGAGLLLVLSLPAEGQGQPARESRIHVGDDGVYTIFTGKIEEGQGARTEIAMAAAEELRVPLSKVRVVTADTDLTPNDGTTAGSRTTPSTIPAVRKAAAAAREAMAQLTPASEWKVMGKSQAPVNARGLVTGAHKFPSDLTRPGMLYGCVLRPPSFGAALESVETSGVNGVAVRDGEFAGCAAPTSYAARKGVEAMAAKAVWRRSRTWRARSSTITFARRRSAMDAARNRRQQATTTPPSAGRRRS
jgi:isoquinoline 1-oxidoreductase